MPSLADAPDLVGFFSYSREDDEDSGGKLSKLRERVQAELRGQLGRTKRDFRLWQDKAAIAHGKLWEDEIKSAIAESVFFIPIVTPTAVRSHHCKFEFNAFLAREKELGRNDLVFPILYIPVPGLADSRWREDPLLLIIGSRQYEQWQQLRHLDASSTEVALRVEKFCANICGALQQPWLSPQERQEAEERRLQEIQQAEARRRDEERRRLEDAETRRRDEEWLRLEKEGRRAAKQEQRRKRLEQEPHLQRALTQWDRVHRVLFLVGGIVLVVLGLLAVIRPFDMGLGWLFLISGIMGSFWTRHAPGVWWSLLSAVLAVAAGLILLGWPERVTLLLTVFFLIEGILSIMYALDHKKAESGRWGWMLVSGIIDLILAAIIWAGLAEWALGSLVGIEVFGGLVGIYMVFGGAARIAMGTAPAVKFVNDFDGP